MDVTQFLHVFDVEMWHRNISSEFVKIVTAHNQFLEYVFNCKENK